MNDIYNRLPSDQSYVVALETDDEIEQILAQIKMLLGTKPGDILCAPYFGVNINRYLFTMNTNQEEMNRIIQQGILTNIDYNEAKYNIVIKVDFGRDHNTGGDYACINVQINQRSYLGIIINQ